jgi:4'-phosphopantetheinyl transferase
MPPSGQVEVWVADLSHVPDSLQRLLSKAERARAQRIANEDVRRCWLASRAVLRELLARDIGADAATIELQLGPHGKPRLASCSDQPVRFNVSHSGTLGLYALCANREVGVDVELAARRGKSKRDEVAIARKMLGGTVASRLQGLADEERKREFLRAWVAHEALVKCLGVGLGGMAAYDSGRIDRPEVWVTSLDVGEAAFAALAVEGGPVAVEQCVWAPVPAGY